MKRSPVRMPRLRPISKTSCAQDTDGFFVVEAATGASETSSAGAFLRGEVAATGAAPSPETGANGGGIEASGTSLRTAAVSSAATVGGASPLAGLVASELFAECGGGAGATGFVFFFRGGLPP